MSHDHAVESHDHAVEVRDLVKTYRARGGRPLAAVDHLSLSVAHGEVFALLGPNGAGKTSTLAILEGLSDATAGTATVLGLDVHRDRPALKRRIGVQLQASSYFEHLTLTEILRLFASFYGRRTDPDALLDIVGLTDKRAALVRHLSGGQAQRFSIVAALVNDPALIFLDEPTTGLDPQARRNLWDVIGRINRDGTTVILTTHSMEEAQVLADRVAIVDRGRLVALGTPGHLIAELGSGHHVQFSTLQAVPEDELRTVPGVDTVDVRRNGHLQYRLAVGDANEALPGLFRWAGARGVTLADVRVTSPTLEDVFLARTGTRLRD